MVHELHKAGYQRLRVSPGLSPSGVHWRCSVTCACNVGPDGFSIIDASEVGGLFAAYTSADTGYFGWPGGAGLSARSWRCASSPPFPG